MKFLYESKQRIEFTNRSIKSAETIMHHAIELYYIKTGKITVMIDNISYEMNAGDLIVIFPDVTHSYFDSVDDRGYLFIMPSDGLKPFREIFSTKQPISPLIYKEKLDETSIPELFEILNKDYKDGNEQYKTALSQTIVARVLSILDYKSIETQFDGYDGKIEEVLKFINTHYNDNPSRKAVARAVGLNENYVSRMFSEKIHCTLLDYIHSLQLQDAAELLSSTRLSVSEISYQAGFNSVRSFTRNFTEKYKISPREYRKSQTNKE